MGKRAKFEIRIGQTDEDRDWAASAVSKIPWLDAPGAGNYIVDIGVEKPFCIIVTDVPLNRTKELYSEAKRRSPSFRCSLLYDCYPLEKDESPRISFKDFVAGKKVNGSTGRKDTTH